jgi:hypothetical protein
VGCTYEGMIEIPLEEFWEFVAKYHPEGGSPVYGVPRANKGNQCMEIDFAMGTDDVCPSEWAVKPDALLQWKDHKD